MRQFIISLECPKRLSNERVVELLGKMLDIGEQDASDTLEMNYENNEPEDKDAREACSITINNILPLG